MASGLRRRDRRSAVRAYAIAVVAWASGATALATALYPALAGALFAFLTGLILVVTLRTSLWVGLGAAALGVPLFVYANLALLVLSADPHASLQVPAVVGHPAVQQLGVWATSVLGGGLLLASATVADSAAAVIGQVRAAPP